jgi:hypothetical protein
MTNEKKDMVQFKGQKLLAEDMDFKIHGYELDINQDDYGNISIHDYSNISDLVCTEVFHSRRKSTPLKRGVFHEQHTN